MKSYDYYISKSLLSMDYTPSEHVALGLVVFSNIIYLSQPVIDANSPNQFKNLLDSHYVNIMYDFIMYFSLCMIWMYRLMPLSKIYNFNYN